MGRTGGEGGPVRISWDVGWVVREEYMEVRGVMELGHEDAWRDVEEIAMHLDYGND